MISVEVTPPTAQMTAISAQLAKTPTLMAVAYKRSMTRLAQRAMTKLRVEPAPRSTVGITRLMTPRQRRYVHALRAARGGGDYERTHAVSQGWKYKVNAAGNGGEVVLYNDNPAAGYVEGFEQQPFLAALGWIYAPQLLAEYSVEAEAVTAETWLTISDPFSGVPQSRT